MNQFKKKLCLGIIIGSAFILGGVTINANRNVPIKSKDGSITIEYENVEAFNYLRLGDITEPPAKMYKQHLEDALAYIIKNDDYDKMAEIFTDVNYSCDAPDRNYAKYVEYIRKGSDFKSLGSLIAYDEVDEMREALISILNRSLEYKGFE